MDHQFLYDNLVGEGGPKHIWKEDGICLRCGEDAEEWESGCVEEIVEALRQQNAQMYEGLQEADVAMQSYIEDYGDNDGCLVGILKGVRAAIAATWTEENRG